MSKIAEARALVGRAFMDEFGCIRWITGVQSRPGVYCRWLAEDGTWHNGGGYLLSGRKSWPSGDEVPAPPAGASVALAGPLGGVDICEVAGIWPLRFRPAVLSSFRVQRWMPPAEVLAEANRRMLADAARFPGGAEHVRLFPIGETIGEQAGS